MVDCVVVGHYDIPMNDLAERVHVSRESSGGYTEIRTNSVRLDGKHLSYSDLFNRWCRQAYGFDPAINPFRAAHTGAIYLANRLRRAGRTADVVGFVSPDRSELIAALRDRRPHIVVFTTTFYVDERPLALLIAEARAQLPEVCIIVGGPYVVSRAFSDRLINVAADVFITDPQGEEALLAVTELILAGADRSELEDVPNLILSRGMRTRRLAEVNDLDAHRIDWSDFADQLTPPVAFIRSARGCSFKCAFCNYPAMSGGHYLASIEGTCRELESLLEQGVTDVAFVDDTFNVPLPRFKKLLREMIQRKYPLRWTSFFRCSNADEECFDLMAESGCRAVFLGIESGDDALLKAMSKSARSDAYARGIKALAARDILTMASYVMGFPGETADSAMRTVDFINENVTTFYNVQLYFHDSMAPIEAQRDVYQIEGSAYSWRHRTMDWREAADWVEYAVSMPTESIPLPLYGFSIWSLPYFEASGLSREDFVKFTSIAGDAFRLGLHDDHAGDGFVERFRAAFPRIDRTLTALPAARGEPLPGSGSRKRAPAGIR